MKFSFSILNRNNGYEYYEEEKEYESRDDAMDSANSWWDSHVLTHPNFDEYCYQIVIEEIVP